jgi:hypothetical protein
MSKRGALSKQDIPQLLKEKHILKFLSSPGEKHEKIMGASP